MYIIKCETDHQSRLDAWDKCSGLVHWEDPEGSGGEGGRRRGSGWGTHVNPWLIHVNVWQKLLQYCKVINLQLIKIIGKKKGLLSMQHLPTTEPAQPRLSVLHLPTVLERSPRELTAIRLRFRSVLKVRNSEYRQAGIHVANHAPKNENRFCN